MTDGPTQWTIFDYGGVISRPQTAADGAALAARAGWPPAEFLERYWAHRIPYDRGDHSATTYWSAVLDRPVDPAEAGELDDQDTASWSHLDPGTQAILQRLAGAGRSLALLSNAPEPLARAIERADWRGLFGQRFYSCRIGAVKPDAAIFAHVLATLGARAADVTFVDDRRDNVEAARALGWRAVLFTTAAELAAALG